MPSGPISSLPPITIVITFDPATQAITADPDPAGFNWATNGSLHWRLTSTDRAATLQKINFEGSNPQGPFSAMAQDPNNDKVWNATECAEVTGTFKYDITVKDGNGNDITVDPILGVGNPPP